MATLEHGPSADDREFGFTRHDFERVKRMIYQRAGISLGACKQNLVYSRVSRRLRACGIATFREYLDRLESTPGSDEWQAFTNALTTNLTSFFREAHHFPILASHLHRCTATRPLMIWCSAASTGEEPYSIAMTACEAFDSLRPPVRIIASDIDTQVLATAQRGVYPLERVRSLDAARLRRFFERGAGSNVGMVRMRSELREMIDYRQINLLDDSWPVRAELAAIFCRNVLIYFDRSTQARIVERFAPLLAPDGLLFAGHSESLAYAKSLFELRGRTVYHRTSAAIAAAAD